MERRLGPGRVASLTRSPVELSLAEEVLPDFIPDGSDPEITADQIGVFTADYALTDF